MPTYEYECGACEHHFEEFQGITEDKLTTCPACGEESLQRLIGAGAAVLFKGSGFYQTDYRSDDYNAKAKADKPGATPSSSGGAKGESKGDGPPAKSEPGSSSSSSSSSSDSAASQSSE